MASFVFTEAVQREVHTQRSDRVNLRSAKAVHSSSQTRQVVIARDGRSGGACEDGANTRDEARRGRCWRRTGSAWPRQAKEKPTGERTVAEEPHAMHVFPVHPAKDQPNSTQYKHFVPYFRIHYGRNAFVGIHYGSPSSRKRHCHSRQTPPRELGEERLPELAASSGRSNCISWAT